MKYKTDYKIIFFTGPPLSGKDTQAKLLSKKINGKVITTHILVEKFFKEHRGKYLKIGKKIFNIQKEKQKRLSGGFYSPEIVGYVVSQRIIKENNKNILIFSGSPRLLTEAKIILKTLKELGLKFLVIFLKVSEKEILKRAKKRRREIEDTEEIVKRRIENFKKYVIPTINFLNKKGYVKEVSGEGRVKEIHKKILSLLI